MNHEFVPVDFVVPKGLIHEEFQLRPLTVADAADDYEAVMESKLQLRVLFGSEWPPDDFTLEQNRSDLVSHEQAFRDRESFTYTVLSPGGQRILGCVYIHPAEEKDAQVIYWIRSSRLGDGLSEELQVALSHWLTSEWPFIEVSFPGRE